MVSSKWFLLFTCVIIFSPGQARFLASNQDEAEALKMVLKYYKAQDRSPVMDSAESESNELATSSPNSPAYRIEIDSRDSNNAGVTEATIASSIPEVEISDDETLTVDNSLTTILPDPEEVEDETTTIFPVEKMEEMGAIPVTTHSKEANVPEPHSTKPLTAEPIVNPDLDSLPENNMIVQFHEESDASEESDQLFPLDPPKQSSTSTTSTTSTTTTTTSTSTTTTSTAPTTNIITPSTTPATTVVELISNGTINPPAILSDDVPTTTSAPTTAVCAEGDLRQEGCNACVCIGGQFLCSQRVCSLFNHTQGVKPIVKKKPDEIENGSRNHTNLTEPAEIGSTSTTVRTTTTPKPECYSGVTKSVDCNMCICSPSQKWACTKRACIALTLREKASYTDGTFVNKTQSLVENADLDEDCIEGEVRNWNCNNCVCFMNSWVCTKQLCPPTTVAPKTEAKKEACHTEEDVKSVDCNICRCQRGEWACSNNDCKRFGNHHQTPPRNKFRFRPHKN